MFSVNFNNIRPINGSANDGFEEFVCQLARKETIPTSASFVRNGKPDGGVECYHILQDHSIVAWQAKYFIKSFETSQYQQIDDSVKTALKSYPKLTRYIIAVPIDPSDVHIKGKKSMKDRIEEYVNRWKEINPNVVYEFWWASLTTNGDAFESKRNVPNWEIDELQEKLVQEWAESKQILFPTLTYKLHLQIL